MTEPPSIPDRLAQTVDDLAGKLGSALMFAPHLLIVAEWICTGIEDRPTLAHMLQAAYMDLPPDIDAACEVALFISTRMLDAPKLECFNCGAPKVECICCLRHRMGGDFYWNTCVDCQVAKAKKAEL